MVVDGQVVCQVRMDRYRLHPDDTLLILNLVASTESFKSGETWSPLCLPQFDSTGFLHAYVSYLSEDCPACLLLLTVNKDIFYPLSEAKQRLVRNYHQTACAFLCSQAPNCDYFCDERLEADSCFVTSGFEF